MLHVLLGALLGAAQAYTIPAVVAASAPAINGAISGEGWPNAAHITLDHDLTYRSGIAGNGTDVYVLTDSHYLYIGWVCRQTSPIVAQQVVNDAGTGADDFVSVTLWPAGSEGIAYSFTTTASGAHSESSSENTAFAPHWEAAAKMVRGGYDVTMRIPRDVLRSTAADWRIQFTRYVSATGQHLVWAYDPNMSSPSDTLYAGTLTGAGASAASRSSIAKSRVQIYGLADLASRDLGRSTSRMGMDYSIPVSKTASFYGTVHPDYSEVEYDQQSIAPSEFQRYYREVRPFFTQGANYFNGDGVTDLYTPAIPTPRYGYALEGANNGLRYAAFNAVGAGRDDNAEAVRFVSNGERFSASFQRTAVEMPGFSDMTESGSVLAGNGKHFAIYAIIGEDNGTRVLDTSQNGYRNLGANLYAPTESIGFNLNSIGLYYNPYDGFITDPDTHGYNGYVSKTWDFKAASRIQSVSFYGYLDRYHDHLGELDQTDNSLSFAVNNDRSSGVSLTSSSDYYLVPGRGIVPFNQPGIALWDAANPAKSFYAGYYAGHYLAGFERYAYVGVSFKVTPNVSIGLSHNQNVFTAPSFPETETEVLDTASLSYKYNRYGAFSLGLRETQGQAADYEPVPFARNANFSCALSQRFAHIHLYAVYGDPNALSTAHDLILKAMFFAEGDEGT